MGIPPINSACYFQEISWKTISPSQIITSRRSQQPTRCSICVEELILPTLARIPWTPTAIAPLKGRWKYHGFAICNSVVDLLLILTNITMAAVFFFSILSPMSTSGPVAQEEEIQEELGLRKLLWVVSIHITITFELLLWFLGFPSWVTKIHIKSGTKRGLYASIGRLCNCMKTSNRKRLELSSERMGRCRLAWNAYWTKRHVWISLFIQV